MNIAKLVLLMLGITLILGAVACGGGGGDSGSKKTVSQDKSDGSSKSSVATTQPAATISPTAHIPPTKASIQQEQSSNQEWVTLTDIEMMFSITVPIHWDTVIDKGRLATQYQSLFEQGLMVLFFGVDTQTGSNVTVIADMQALVTEEPQPINRGEYVEIQLADLKQQANFSGEISEKEVTIDGINGTQLRYVMGGEVNQIANILLGNEPRMSCGSLGILMTGTAPDAALAVVEQILDSFRVLPTAAITATCNDRKALSLLEQLGSVVGVTEEMVEVDGLRLLEWGLKSHEYGLVTIVGVVQNTTDDLKEWVYITFDVYDKEGYSLGQAEAMTERLHAGKKWRFEATAFTEEELGEIELYNLGTYD